MADATQSKRRIVRTTAAPAVACIALALTSLAAAATPALSLVEAETLGRSPAATASLSELRRFIDAGDDVRIAAALETLATATVASAPASEATLYTLLLELAEKPAGHAVRAVVERLAGRAPQLFVEHSDGAALRPVPLFDAGAAARYALRRWHASGVATEARARLQKGGTLSAFGGDSRAVKAGLATAVDGTSLTDLLRSRDALAAALVSDTTLARAALIAAVALRDADLFVAVIHHGEDRDALDALGAASVLIDPAAAARVIDAGLARDATASRAVFALAERARSDPQARARLLTLPGSPRHGESAAAALARLEDPALTRTLGDLLFHEADERRAIHLALALRLTDSAEAQGALALYAAMPGAHPRLRSRLRGTSL